MYQKQPYSNHLILLQNHILIKKNYVMALQKRLEHIRDGFALKSDYEKNEVDVLTYETLIKINTVSQNITRLEQKFLDDFEDFINDITDCDMQYVAVIELAKSMQSNNINIKHILYDVNWKTIDEDIEQKIQLYKTLMNLTKTA